MLLSKFFHTIKKIHSNIREAQKEHLRSPRWRKVRDEFLLENDFCAACGTHKHLQVHHMKPFHLEPSLELDKNNLIVLCMDTEECHLSIGHGDSFQFYNPHVVEDVKKFRLATKEERNLIKEIASSNRMKD